MPRTLLEWRGLFVLPGIEPQFLGGPVRSLVTKRPTQSVMQRLNNAITLIRTGVQCHVRQILMKDFHHQLPNDRRRHVLSPQRRNSAPNLCGPSLDTRLSRILIPFLKWVGKDSPDVSLLSGVLHTALGSYTFSELVRFVRNRTPPSLDLT